MSTERELTPGGPNSSLLNLPSAFADFKDMSGSVNLLEKVYGEFWIFFLEIISNLFIRTIFHWPKFGRFWRKQILRSDFTYLVDLTFSENGSKVTLILFTPFKFICFNCFPMAETTPPDFLKVPLKGIDILIYKIYLRKSYVFLVIIGYHNTFLLFSRRRRIQCGM